MFLVFATIETSTSQRRSGDRFAVVARLGRVGHGYLEGEASPNGTHGAATSLHISLPILENIIIEFQVFFLAWHQRHPCKSPKYFPINPPPLLGQSLHGETALATGSPKEAVHLLHGLNASRLFFHSYTNMINVRMQ